MHALTILDPIALGISSWGGSSRIAWHHGKGEGAGIQVLKYTTDFMFNYLNKYW